MKRPTRPLVEERGQHCEAHVDFGFIVHTASATRQDQVLLHLFRDDLFVMEDLHWVDPSTLELLRGYPETTLGKTVCLLDRACRVTEVRDIDQRFQPKEHQVLVLG